MAKRLKPPLDQKFWSATGMRKLIELINDQCELQGQNELAARVGVTSSTFTNIRDNYFGLVRIPDPNTILHIGSAITDPDTGMPFDPWKFLLIATQFTPTDRKLSIQLIKDLVKNLSKRDINELQDFIATQKNMIADQSALSRLISYFIDKDNLSRAAFAKRCGLRVPDIDKVVDTFDLIEDRIFEGLAVGLSASSPGWTVEALKAIEPERGQGFSANQLLIAN